MKLDTAQIKEFYDKYKTVIWPIVVGGSCLLIALLVIVPQLLVYFNLRTKANELEDRLGILTAKAEELEQLDDQSNVANLKLALTALPEDKQIPQSLNLLQNFITQSNLTIENIKFVSGTGSTSPNSKENSYYLGVTVLGTMDSLKRLLASLNNSPRIYKLESINAQAVRSANMVEADMTLQVFYEPNSRNLGPLDQPVPKLTETDQKILAEVADKIRFSSTASASFTLPLGKSDPFQ